jgi:hypothetical protein
VRSVEKLCGRLREEGREKLSVDDILEQSVGDEEQQYVCVLRVGEVRTQRPCWCEWQCSGVERIAVPAGHATWSSDPLRAVMQEDVRKGLIVAAALVSGLILLLALVIFILARSGILEGIGHL